VSREVIREGKGLSVSFGAASQYKESCVAKCEELITQVFSVAPSFKSFLVTKAV
jgi:hypothetical protein